MKSKIIVLSALMFFVGAIAWFVFDNNANVISSNASKEIELVPAYVGVKNCVQCHQQQVDDWRGSHHDLAMQHANDKSVLGRLRPDTI